MEQLSILSLSSIQLPLNSIYLDPNNPRFTNESTIRVPDDSIDNPSLQRDLIFRIQREFPVGPLMDSIEQNGYLPIDRIVIRKFKDEKYVVLEGNRRITAAKILLDRQASKNIELRPSVLETLLEIPALLYTGSDSDAAWVFQGLRHISGILSWPAYNKARLLVQVMEENSLSVTEAGKIFGLSGQAAGQFVRAYETYKQALEHPDYDDVVDEKLFPYLQEIFGRGNVALRRWLGWSDEERSFTNEENFDLFMSWLYPKINDQGEEDPDKSGDWEKRRVLRAIDLREISDLIVNDPDEFTAFLHGMDLSEVIARRTVKALSRKEDPAFYLRTINEFIDQMKKLPIVEIAESDKGVAVADSVKRLKGTLDSVLKYLGNE